MVTSADSGGKVIQVDVTAEPHKQGPPLHIHRRFVERYDIKEGRALARPTYDVQKVLFALLAPLGRLFGYRASA